MNVQLTGGKRKVRFSGAVSVVGETADSVRVDEPCSYDRIIFVSSPACLGQSGRGVDDQQPWMEDIGTRAIQVGAGMETPVQFAFRVCTSTYEVEGSGGNPRTPHGF